MREVFITLSLQDLARKTTFFEGYSWFKFNNIGLARVMSSKFYASVASTKTKSQKVLGTTSFVEVTGEKLVGGLFAPPTSFGIGLRSLSLFSTNTVYNSDNS